MAPDAVGSRPARRAERGAPPPKSRDSKPALRPAERGARGVLDVVAGAVLKGVVPALLAVLVMAVPASGQDLTYEPTNPAFGGSPVNYRWMLNSANQQNPYSEQEQFSSFRDDPLANFEQQIQRQVLDQLSREIIEDRFGDVDLTEEGQYDFQNFTVRVTPGPSGINIRVFNKQTGESSTIDIPRF